MVSGLSEVQEKRGWYVWIMVRYEQSKMAAMMVTIFYIENAYVVWINCDS